MERTINRPVINAGEKNTKRRYLTRVGAAALALGLGTGVVLTGTAAGDSEPKARPKKVERVFFADGHRFERYILPKFVEVLGREDIKPNREVATTTTLPPATTTTAPPPPRIAYDESLWMALHQCEQQETWHAGGHFGNGLVSGGNGLGMSADAWRMAVNDAADRGVTLPSTGWEASIDQQMQAAQVFYEDEGWGWACHVGGH